MRWPPAHAPEAKVSVHPQEVPRRITWHPTATALEELPMVLTAYSRSAADRSRNVVTRRPAVSETVGQGSPAWRPDLTEAQFSRLLRARAQAFLLARGPVLSQLPFSSWLAGRC
jgi:hypothetical protein